MTCRDKPDTYVAKMARLRKEFRAAAAAGDADDEMDMIGSSDDVNGQDDGLSVFDS